jgi:hypothetical protein
LEIDLPERPTFSSELIMDLYVFIIGLTELQDQFKISPTSFCYDMLKNIMEDLYKSACGLRLKGEKKNWPDLARTSTKYRVYQIGSPEYSFLNLLYGTIRRLLFSGFGKPSKFLEDFYRAIKGCGIASLHPWNDVKKDKNIINMLKIDSANNLLSQEERKLVKKIKLSRSDQSFIAFCSKKWNQNQWDLVLKEIRIRNKKISDCLKPEGLSIMFGRMKVRTKIINMPDVKKDIGKKGWKPYSVPYEYILGELRDYSQLQLFNPCDLIACIKDLPRLSQRGNREERISLRSTMRKSKNNGVTTNNDHITLYLSDKLDRQKLTEDEKTKRLEKKIEYYDLILEQYLTLINQ